MTEQERPDVEAELSGLMDFQRRTVDRVHDRFFGNDPTRKFLVADEVGLGKTLVARGVIARTIDQLWDTVDRIDVVYICSNSQIAQQNLPKLRVGADARERLYADRLTLLATELRRLEGRKLNFVSFTPGTSFTISQSGGRAEERVLLYWLLKTAWSSEVRKGPWVRFFQGAARKSFGDRIDAFDTSQLTPELGRDFAEAMTRLPGSDGGTLADDIRACVDDFRRTTGEPSREVSSRRYRLIGRMREALALTAVERLEPDLVILDEFQRFKDLMSDEGEGSDLARALFEHRDARLLLLSATPFKMYTLPDEPEGDDHYSDFLDTVRFLAGPERAATVGRELAELRRGLYGDDIEAAKTARDRVQHELRRVMSRTERLATTPDRDGLVDTRTLPDVRLEPEDVRDFRRLQAVSTVVRGQDPLEYWRAAPYVLELMESYQIKQRLMRHEPTDPALLGGLAQSAPGLRWEEVRRYAALDPRNAKMRGLVADVLDRGAARLVWLPPSLPYHQLDGAYAEPRLQEMTKRLVFSSWAVAPKAIATVLSYEAERRVNEEDVRSSSAARSAYDARPNGLLTFSRSDGRLSGMPALALLYPCATLAAVGDPLAVARERGLALPMAWSEVETHVRATIDRLLASLPPGVSQVDGGGAPDADWYWAAGVLLDRARGLELVGALTYGFQADPDDTTETVFAQHTAEAAGVDPERLGPRPDDLAEVLTLLALGGLGNISLRALSRVSGGPAVLDDPDVRDAASSAAWALRNLFNRPEVMAIVRGRGGDAAYWQDVLVHCVHGGLQSVLDEYVFTLSADVGVTATGSARAGQVARRLDAGVSLRAAALGFTDLDVRDGRLEAESHTLRTHFAVRFGRGTADDDQSLMREGQVRAAFNSPFWPFVLASTSVGQEGLDFHHYCHAIVHWNLPGNPVDLEQREGRVHRFRGHAVRRNVAAVYGDRPTVAAADNPWDELFRLAAADREPGASELYPSWVPPLAGPARIERYVPALPLSRESHALTRLLRTAGAYRMVLGQPRQQDLVEYLGDRAGQLHDVMIDLEPGPRA